MVYASESLALAALEFLVNVDPTTAPNDLRAIPADVPEDVPKKTLSADVLPKNWRSFPSPPELALLGANWAESLETAVLRVTSVRVAVAAMIASIHASSLGLATITPCIHVVNTARCYQTIQYQWFGFKIAVLPAIPFEFDVRVWRKKAPGR